MPRLLSRSGVVPDEPCRIVVRVSANRSMTRSLLVLAAVAAAILSQDFTGKVVSITDGGTIRVLCNGVAERIRRWGIDRSEST